MQSRIIHIDSQPDIVRERLHFNDTRKDKSMNSKQSIVSIIVLAAIGMTSFASAAAPTITGVTAQQRYPWNGKVDISYTVTGDIAEEAKQQAVLTSLKVTATDRDANKTYTATQLSGDTALTAGTHAIVWDMDAEGFPLPFKSSNVVFKVSCETTPATYCVIDLSAGANASSYPVTYLAAPPSGGFNVDAYKTTKLVLKRIEAGTFIMGEDQTDESHRVTLTKAFFCGLFEMTQRQYELVTGSNPCSSTSYGEGNTYPVYCVSYNMIRGASNGAMWPSSSAVDSSSFMGKLRVRTGLDFDLPTEAQWEYACRAGTTTTYSYGNSANEDYMWYEGNSESKTHPVGMKSANICGLYDMHGNVCEWCLDWYGSTLSYDTDPQGPYSGTYRARRGGGWYYGASHCTSSHRIYGYPWGEDNDRGFRLFRTLSNTGNVYLDVLCSGESEMGKVDLVSSTRMAAQTEQICYSSMWEDGAVSEATAVVEVNGETLSSAVGSGYVDWTPMSNGIYTLTHKVMSGDEQVGETLTVIFLVEGLAPIYTSTQTTPVPVPYAWLTQYEPDIVDEYDAYEAAANATASNGRNKVWECFVAGISPTNETASFTARIEMKDGVPVVTWEPDLNTNGVVRTYKVYGSETLENGGEWQYPTNSLHRFFKVTVEMP